MPWTASGSRRHGSPRGAATWPASSPQAAGCWRAGTGAAPRRRSTSPPEIVGRFKDERIPLSAISLHADTSALTAIANDYGIDEMFARGVRAHGRPGDVLVALSTSGTSPNVLAAVKAAHE